MSRLHCERLMTEDSHAAALELVADILEADEQDAGSDVVECLSGKSAEV